MEDEADLEEEDLEEEGEEGEEVVFLELGRSAFFLGMRDFFAGRSLVASSGRGDEGGEGKGREAMLDKAR